jgi:23S rRNA (uracil1939-C5)-methyltransferase
LRARVESIAAGGLGLVRLPSGEITFVAGVLDGELVSLRTGTGKRAQLDRVVEASERRVAPPCRYATSCGGCDFMHIDAGHQRTLHREIVQALVSHACGPCPEITMHSPTPALRYRSRARFALGNEHGKLRVGYRGHGSRDIVAIDDCLVLDEALMAAARATTDALKGVRGEGEISVAFGARDGARLPVVDVTLASDPPTSFVGWLSRECTAPGPFAGARVSLGATSKPLVFGDPRAVQPGTDGLPVLIRAGGFAQASDEGAALLAARASALARTEGCSVLELFSGSGTLSIALAKGARAFSSVEEDAEAVACARQNLDARGLTGKLRVGNAEATDIPAQLDVVVLDPPRAGAPAATRAIAAARPKRVLYVSCDPATLARDLKQLCAAGYALDALETVELFPQTSHVETLALLSRARGGRASRTDSPEHGK